MGALARPSCRVGTGVGTGSGCRWLWPPLRPVFLPQSFSSAAKAPVQVIVLRALAFLACTFLLTIAFYGTSNPFAPEATLPPALPPGGNGSAAPDNGTAPGVDGWQQLLGLLPEHAAEKLREAWAFGQSHQMGVVALGLLTCLLAMLLAGRIRCVWGRAGPGLGGRKRARVEAERLCWAHGHTLGSAVWPEPDTVSLPRQLGV